VAVTICTQKDYFETEATIDPKCEIAEVSDLLRALKTNCKMIILYNGGSVQAINIEMHTKVNETQSEEIRDLLGLKSVSL
jgi:hypothetical protein